MQTKQKCYFKYVEKCGKLKHIAQTKRKSNKKKTEKIIYININKIKSRKIKKK